jgi:hypothetical protein
MMILNKSLLYFILISMIALIVLIRPVFSEIIETDGKTFIVDRHGERWDITQARSIGFDPGRFQHGIGRNAFQPLDDSSFSPDKESVSGNSRVLGISDGEEANAYSISKLSRHETANSHIGDQPITAAY